MKHIDIPKAEWRALKNSIKQPDNSFDLRDLERAVAEKYGVDEKTAKRLVRRHDQQSTIKPRELARLWGSF